jgi:hypothetical protein
MKLIHAARSSTVKISRLLFLLRLSTADFKGRTKLSLGYSDLTSSLAGSS